MWKDGHGIMNKTATSIIMEIKAFILKALFSDKFTVDFCQRELICIKSFVK